MIRKYSVLIMILGLLLLSGCQNNNDPSKPTPTEGQSTPTTATETDKDTTTVSPSINPTVSPSASPATSYQPIQVTHTPVSPTPQTGSDSSQNTNRAPVLDTSKLSSTLFSLKQGGVVGDDATLGNTPNAEVKGNTSFTARITGSDPEGGKINYSVAAAANGASAKSMESTYGNIEINILGEFTYTLKDSSKALNQKQTAVDYFMVRVTDEQGAYSEILITVNIEGTNSKPVLTLDASSIQISTQPISGKLGLSDLNADGLAEIPLLVEGCNIGTENILIEDENWQFTLDYQGNYTMTPKNPINQSVPIAITLKDVHGSTDEKTITFNFSGNIAPVIEKSYENLVLEKQSDGDVIYSGTLNATDANHDTLTFSVSSSAGKYGTLSLNASTGEFSYKLNENLSASSSPYLESFTITVSDGHGGTDTTTLSFHITVTYTPNASEDIQQQDPAPVEDPAADID